MCCLYRGVVMREIFTQNLQPFEMHKLLRYGGTFFALKLLLLRLTLSRSFRKADGVIFLTEYAAWYRSWQLSLILRKHRAHTQR